MLKDEVSAGNATYINATSRGFDPKIPSLQKAQAIADKISRLWQKITKKKDTHQHFSHDEHKKKISLADIHKIKNYRDKMALQK